MKEDIFYVGIKNPLELRKNLLENSKNIIKNLQRHEHFKAIREEKIEQIMKLKSVMNDIKKLNIRLKAELPKTELRAKREKPAPSKKTTSLRKTPKKSEIERLEKELDFIESKLKDIS